MSVRLREWDDEEGENEGHERREAKKKVKCSEEMWRDGWKKKLEVNEWDEGKIVLRKSCLPRPSYNNPRSYIRIVKEKENTTKLKKK